ncbi:carbohydrate ABC transporter permease, partial [Burkholderia cenocepacia]|uniref:carbohydrate ABC transporter permease n=1 Tax=Burkholderia cenocepacia TaxID=95486 RepID=UPI0038CC1474
GPTAMLAVIVVQVFKNVGLNMVLFLAALQGVPRELTEAAAIDGAGPARIFARITMPMISPTIMLTLIITIVGSLQVFAQIAVLTQGGPGISTTVLVYYLVQQAFDFHAFGYGSTLSILLFLIVLVLTIVQWQLRKRWVFHEA